jgi:hypothetical protein
MEELAFGELPLGARFYYMGERYVKASPTEAEFRGRRAFSKNPLHYGDMLELAEAERVARVVRTFGRLLPEGHVLAPNGYHNGNYYVIKSF